MSNRCEVRPIIGQVVHDLPVWAVHNRLADRAIRVVRRSDNLDERLVLVEFVRVSLPFVEFGLKELYNLLIAIFCMMVHRRDFVPNLMLLLLDH